MLRALNKNLIASALVLISVGLFTLANAKPFLITYKGGLCPTTDPAVGQCKAIINFPFTTMASQVQLLGLNGQPLAQGIDYDCAAIDSYVTIHDFDGARLLYVGNGGTTSMFAYAPNSDADIAPDSAMSIVDQTNIIDQNLNSVITFRSEDDPNGDGANLFFRTFIAAGQNQSSLFVPYITANPVSFEVKGGGPKSNTKGHPETPAERKARLFPPRVINMWKIHEFMWKIDDLRTLNKKLYGTREFIFSSQMGDYDTDDFGWNLPGRSPWYWLTVRIRPMQSNYNLLPQIKYEVIRNNGILAKSGNFANGSEISIDVSDLTPELYFIVFRYQGVVMGVDKFVKVNQ